MCALKALDHQFSRDALHRRAFGDNTQPALAVVLRVAGVRLLVKADDVGAIGALTLVDRHCIFGFARLWINLSFAFTKLLHGVGKLFGAAVVQRCLGDQHGVADDRLVKRQNFGLTTFEFRQVRLSADVSNSDSLFTAKHKLCCAVVPDAVVRNVITLFKPLFCCRFRYGPHLSQKFNLAFVVRVVLAAHLFQ